MLFSYFLDFLSNIIFEHVVLKIVEVSRIDRPEYFVNSVFKCIFHLTSFTLLVKEIYHGNMAASNEIIGREVNETLMTVLLFL